MRPTQARSLLQAAFSDSTNILSAFLAEDRNIDAIERFVDFSVGALGSTGRVFACGNGGSMSDAMHFTEELAGRSRNHRPALPAITFSDPATLTCIANDYGYASVFSRQVEAQAKRGDVLVLLSTSGNSPNLIEAAKTAQGLGVTTVGLLGRGGGKLLPEVTVPILVPLAETSDRIQEVQMLVLHVVTEAIEQRLFKS